jgi:hypothetical protein
MTVARRASSRPQAAEVVLFTPRHYLQVVAGHFDFLYVTLFKPRVIAYNKNPDNAPVNIAGITAINPQNNVA